MKKYRIIVVVLLALMQCIVIARSDAKTSDLRDTVRFSMKIDTTLRGIYAGQEFELKYISNADYDSIMPPDFSDEIEVVEGPKPHRAGHAIKNGILTEIYEYGFTYRVRFKKEGKIELPLSSIKVGGKEYTTPPMCVMVHSSVANIDAVRCTLLIKDRPQIGEKTNIILVCNRRPDSTKPKLSVNGDVFTSYGSGTSLSSDKEEYSFYYFVTFQEGGRYTITCNDLAFGGISYTMDPQTINVGQGRDGGERSGNAVFEVLGAIVFYMLGMWLILRHCYRKEKDAELAPFVLEHQYLPLNVEWAFTHYAFPQFLLCLPVCFLFFNAWTYFINGDNNALFFPLFWCGLLPASLSYITYRKQRSKLNFECVKTSLDKRAIQEAFMQTAEQNNWTIDHIGDDCMVAHTNPSMWAFSYGEQIFLVFDTEQVWINSVNDLNKRASMGSFGYTKKNLKLIREML